MSKFSRDKGLREERAIVNTWQEAGLGAERVPLSGSAGGSFTGDVTIPFCGVDNVFEAKTRSVGFKQIYDWLGDNFGLFIRQTRQERLVVIREKHLIALVKDAEAHRAANAQRSAAA